jgi:hypothetical protein
MSPKTTMNRTKRRPAGFEGPIYDSRHGYDPETGMAIRDGARCNRADPARYRAAMVDVKVCRGCSHWARAHPDHGRCLFFSFKGDLVPCGCQAFVDPEPGRPDRVLTRDQVDRMLRYRWEAIKDRVYLMKDGRYGVLDRYTDRDKYFA